jgi:hypothetical protein
MLYVLRHPHIPVRLWNVTSGHEWLEVRSSCCYPLSRLFPLIAKGTSRNKRGACRSRCKIGNFDSQMPSSLANTYLPITCYSNQVPAMVTRLGQACDCPSNHQRLLPGPFPSLPHVTNAFYHYMQQGRSIALYRACSSFLSFAWGTETTPEDPWQMKLKRSTSQRSQQLRDFPPLTCRSQCLARVRKHVAMVDRMIVMQGNHLAYLVVQYVQ